MQTDRFQCVERAAGIDLEIIDGILQASGHRDLSCEMQYRTGPAHRPDDGNGIADITGDNGDLVAVSRFQPLRIIPNAGAGQIVKGDYLLSTLCQRVGQVAADKAAAAGDQDRSIAIPNVLHATSPRRASSSVAFST